MQKCNFEVFVNVDLFGPKVYDLFRLAESGFHLFRRLAFINLLRRCLLLRLSSTTTALVAALLIVSAPPTVSILCSLAVILLGGSAGVDCDDLADHVLNLRDAGTPQTSLGGLEDDFRFVE